MLSTSEMAFQTLLTFFCETKENVFLNTIKSEWGPKQKNKTTTKKQTREA